MFSTLRRLRHTAGMLRAFVDNIRQPDADAVLRMDIHGTALATEEDRARFIAGIRADAPTRELLRDRWIPPRLTLAQLLDLPAGSLGRAYGEHLVAFDLDIEYFDPIEDTGDDAFVRRRLYQIHDIIHALTDYDATDEGEMGIVGFYLAQYLVHHDEGGHMAGSFMALLGASVILHAAAIDNTKLRPFLDNLVEGYQRGREARCLIGPRWEQMLHRSLTELRAEYAIPDRPSSTAAVASA